MLVKNVYKNPESLQISYLLILAIFNILKLYIPGVNGTLVCRSAVIRDVIQYPPAAGCATVQSQLIVFHTVKSLYLIFSLLQRKKSLFVIRHTHFSFKLLHSLLTRLSSSLLTQFYVCHKDVSYNFHVWYSHSINKHVLYKKNIY